ncbi:MAG: hypothetical protein EOO51_09530 [Flavobacterium sp.]|nr:MAG: hypothetical protein EOO51_09530 [Flavobacterium sp.]
MEKPHKEYSEDDSLDTGKMAAEYGNEPHKMGSDNTGNADFGKTEDFPSDSTTGSGFSELEREHQDGTNAIRDSQDNGSQLLTDSYNINDKAHSDSSLDDFVKTTSNYHHADEPDDDPGSDSRH